MVDYIRVPVAQTKYECFMVWKGTHLLGIIVRRDNIFGSNMDIENGWAVITGKEIEKYLQEKEVPPEYIFSEGLPFKLIPTAHGFLKRKEAREYLEGEYDEDMSYM